MSNSPSGYALKNGEGPRIHFRGTQMIVKVSHEQSDGSFSLIEMVHPPDVGPALHIHPHGAEAFYVLEGGYTIHCDQDVYHASSGDFVFIPKGVAHKYEVGANGGRVLVIAPAGLERYFAEVADALQIGPLTWEQEQEIAGRYGQEFLDALKHWGH